MFELRERLKDGREALERIKSAQTMWMVRETAAEAIAAIDVTDEGSGRVIDKSAFRATFSDFRIVKGRKVAQFIFETPIEGADAALEALGGVPRSDAEVWAGIARLDLSKASHEPRKPSGEISPPKESTPKERRRLASLPLPQQAAMRCDDKEFQIFIALRG